MNEGLQCKWSQLFLMAPRTEMPPRTEDGEEGREGLTNRHTFPDDRRYHQKDKPGLEHVEKKTDAGHGACVSSARREGYKGWLSGRMRLCLILAPILSIR